MVVQALETTPLKQASFPVPEVLPPPKNLSENPVGTLWACSFIT